MSGPASAWMKILLPATVFTVIASPTLAAEDASLELAEKLTNPFADLITIPINQNPDFEIGPDKGWRYTVTLQPVIPIHLNPNWNIISRTVIPAIYQDSGGKSDFGLGDIAQSLFLSPTNATDSGWCWGVGPIFLLPTATEERFGADQWGIGPTLGLLKRSGQWTIGALTNHIWSLGSTQGHTNVNATFLQPFIDYTMKSKTTFSVNTESTYDWTNEQWTVPFNFVVRQLFNIGGQEVSVALGMRYYAETPAGGPKWGVRLGVTLLFPKRSARLKP
jgi:hypothetical protein